MQGFIDKIEDEAGDVSASFPPLTLSTFREVNMAKASLPNTRTQNKRYRYGSEHHWYQHGGSVNGKNSPEYSAWCAIKRRCLNPNQNRWYRYGGRGIKVCDRWLHSFENFLADMGPKPSPKHTIDRIDTDGDYCPENCRWLTNKEQSGNRSTNVLLTIDGITRNATEWGKIVGINPMAIHKRVRRGWDDYSAVYAPLGTRLVVNK